ncbi:MAG: hypothetical protein JST76_03675 [Bacteroidetes bacterium]|nr:hypothetical protein [Bacteroidota bacterium]
MDLRYRNESIIRSAKKRLYWHILAGVVMAVCALFMPYGNELICAVLPVALVLLTIRVLRDALAVQDIHYSDWYGGGEYRATVIFPYVIYLVVTGILFFRGTVVDGSALLYPIAIPASVVLVLLFVYLWRVLRYMLLSYIYVLLYTIFFFFLYVNALNVRLDHAPLRQYEARVLDTKVTTGSKGSLNYWLLLSAWGPKQTPCWESVSEEEYSRAMHSRILLYLHRGALRSAWYEAEVRDTATTVH